LPPTTKHRQKWGSRRSVVKMRKSGSENQRSLHGRIIAQGKHEDRLQEKKKCIQELLQRPQLFSLRNGQTRPVSKTNSHRLKSAVGPSFSAAENRHLFLVTGVGKWDRGRFAVLIRSNEPGRMHCIDSSKSRIEVVKSITEKTLGERRKRGRDGTHPPFPDRNSSLVVNSICDKEPELTYILIFPNDARGVQGTKGLIKR